MMGLAPSSPTVVSTVTVASLRWLWQQLLHATFQFPRLVSSYRHTLKKKESCVAVFSLVDLPRDGRVRLLLTGTVFDYFSLRHPSLFLDNSLDHSALLVLHSRATGVYVISRITLSNFNFQFQLSLFNSAICFTFRLKKSSSWTSHLSRFSFSLIIVSA